MKKTLFLGMLLGAAVCCSTVFATDYNVTGSNEGTAAFNTQYADGLTLNSGDALVLNLSQSHNTRTLDYTTAATLTPNITLNGGRISLADSVWYLSGTTTANGNSTIIGSNAKFITLAKLEGSGTITSTKNNGDGSAARALQLIGDNSGFTGTIELVNNNSNNTGTNYVVVSHENAIINASVVLTDNTKTNAIALNVASASVKSISGKGDIVVAKNAGFDGAANQTTATLKITDASTFSGGVGAGVTLNLAAGSNMTLTSKASNASITGSGTLVIQTGELQYHSDTGMDSFAGDVIIKSVVHIGDKSNKFNSANTLTVAEGGAINAWGNSGSFSHALILAGGALNLDGANRNFSGAMTLKENTTSQITNTANTLTISGGISGTGSLTKKNAGSFTISGDSNAFNSLKVEGGTVNINGATTLSGSLESGSNTINITKDVTVGNYVSTGTNGRINISNGATLSVRDSSSGQGIWIDADAVLTVKDTASISIADGALVVKTKDSSTDATVSRLDNTATAKLGVQNNSNNSPIFLNNVVFTNAEVIYSGTGTLSLGGMQGGKLDASGKNVDIAAASSTIDALTLSGSTITLGAEHSGSLTTTALNVQSDSTMNGNLIVKSGTMTFADGAALTMGCDVSIGTEGTVTMELSATMAETLAAGENVVLFKGVDNATLQNIAFTGATSNLENLAMLYDSASHNIYMTTSVPTPEPATGTLSLLALAGLCARRRRK